MAIINGTSIGETLTGTGDADTLSGRGGNDVLIGLSGIDRLFGGSGNDRLDGGDGDDTLDGGAGDDTYLVDSVNDLLIELAAGGIDRVFSSVDWTLGANFEHLFLQGSATIGTGNSSNNSLVGDVLNDVLSGLGGNDVLNGKAGDDTLRGGGGNDTLTGGGGNDVLDGGGGNDRMSGGAGNDNYVVGQSGDVVLESTDGGIDTIRSGLTAYTLGAELENLELLGAAVSGTGNTLNNTIIGNGLANTLTGGAGNDYLDGGLGNDRLHGGAGNDIYVVNAIDDLVIDASGTELIYASVSYALSDGLENLTLIGARTIATDALFQDCAVNVNGVWVTWLSPFDGQVWIQRLSLDAVPVGAAVMLSTPRTFPAAAGHTSIVTLADESILVSARTGPNSRTPEIPDYRGGLFWIMSPTGQQMSSTLVGEGGWSYGVSTTKVTQNVVSASHIEINNWDVRLYVLPENGQKSVFDVASNTSGFQISPKLLDLGDSNHLLVIWTDNAGLSVPLNERDTSGFGVYGRVFSVIDGSFSSPVFLVNQVAAGIQGGWGGRYENQNYSLTLMPDGGFAVFWMTDQSGGYGAFSTAGIAGRIYEKTATGYRPKTDEFSISLSPEKSATFVDACVTDAGEIIVAYSTFESGLTSVFAQKISGQGEAGLPVLIGTTSGASAFPTIELISGSTALVTWVTGANVPSSDYDTGELVLSRIDLYSLDSGVGSRGIGNDADNALTGDAGHNTLEGGGGGDTLTGNGSCDRLVGGEGNDVFIFSTAPDLGNVDAIVDFEGAGSQSGDMIHLLSGFFPTLTAGNLAEAAFETGADNTAGAVSTRIIYNTSTGALFYDADGSGVGASAVQFATLVNKPAGLDASDFIIV